MPRPSPLQNRVAPDGSLAAVPERGTLMGNRGGRLHRADGHLGPCRWRSRAWITCALQFRGRRRRVWEDGYSEVFFLDEATALAAGHRPCFECRRAAARAFAAAWAASAGLAAPPRAGEMDAALHATRRGAPEPVAFGRLPEAAVFQAADGFWLRTRDGARRWSFAGYGPPQRFEPSAVVLAVTPAPTRGALAAGYRPALHDSVRS